MDTWSELVVGRRWLLTRTGRGALGIAILGVAACAGDTEEDPPTGSSPSESPTVVQVTHHE